MSISDLLDVKNSLEFIAIISSQLDYKINSSKLFMMEFQNIFVFLIHYWIFPINLMYSKVNDKNINTLLLFNLRLVVQKRLVAIQRSNGSLTSILFYSILNCTAIIRTQFQHALNAKFSMYKLLIVNGGEINEWYALFRCRLNTVFLYLVLTFRLP